MNMHKYYIKNKDNILERSGAYYRKKKQTDPDFMKNRRLQSKKYRLEHPEIQHWYREYSNKRRQETFYALGNKCGKCDLSDKRILHLHHKHGRPKGEYKAKWKTIDYPLSKLEILCPNCHAIEHLEGNKS